MAQATASRRILVCQSRGDCPGCGESLYDTQHIELHDHYLGVERPSWTLYYCRRCGTWFRVYWPSMVAASARLKRILAGEEARGW